MSSVNIGVLISGGGTNLQAIIDNVNLGNINGEIKLIVSNKKDAYGLIRGNLAGIETLYIDEKLFKTNKEYDAKIIKEFKSRNIDLVVLAG
ncbi:MAG TPA: formyltransferase family protein, partial [Tissierellaceae bacterium]|nr:formyltransferase family protein [Tissierellaceae bacterium]